MFVFVHVMCKCAETHTLNEDKEIQQLLAVNVGPVSLVYGLSSKGNMFSPQNISCLHACAVYLCCVNKFGLGLLVLVKSTAC